MFHKLTALTHEAPEKYATPRWVKVFGVIALIVVVLVVIVLATGRGGEHGPSRHGIPTLGQPQSGA